MSYIPGGRHPNCTWRTVLPRFREPVLLGILSNLCRRALGFVTNMAWRQDTFNITMCALSL